MLGNAHTLVSTLRLCHSRVSTRPSSIQEGWLARHRHAPSLHLTLGDRPAQVGLTGVAAVPKVQPQPRAEPPKPRRPRATSPAHGTCRAGAATATAGLSPIYTPSWGASERASGTQAPHWALPAMHRPLQGLERPGEVWHPALFAHTHDSSQSTHTLGQFFKCSKINLGFILFSQQHTYLAPRVPGAHGGATRPPGSAGRPRAQEAAHPASVRGVLAAAVTVPELLTLSGKWGFTALYPHLPTHPQISPGLTEIGPLPPP